MKKSVGFILAAGLLCMSACGNRSEMSEASSDTGMEAVSVMSETPSEQEEDFSNEGVTNEVRDPVSVSFDSFDAGDNITLLDDKYVAVTVETVGKDEYGTYNVAMKIGNKYEKAVAVYANRTCVNGADLSADSWFYEEVQNGEEKTVQLQFTENALEKAGISDLRRIELYITVGEAETGHDLERKGFTIYPDGKEEGTKPLYEIKDSDIMLVDNEEISICLTGYGADPDRLSMDGYVINRTETYTSLVFDGVTVNGTEYAAYGGTDVFPNSEAFFHIYWDEAGAGPGSFEDGAEALLFLYAADIETLTDLWEERVSFSVPEGFSGYLSKKPSEKTSVWIPAAVSSSSVVTDGGDPYANGMAGIEIGEVVVEIPMDMFGKIEEISGDSMSFYREDSYVIIDIEDAAGTNGSLLGDAEAFARKVAEEIGGKMVWEAGRTAIFGNEAIEVRFKDISTSQIRDLDFDLVAFNYNGMFYAFGIGVLDDSYDIEQAFVRLKNSIAPV